MITKKKPKRLLFRISPFMKKILVITNIVSVLLIVWLIYEGGFVKRAGGFFVKAFDIKDNYTYEMNPNYRTDAEKFMLSDRQADIVMLGNSITAQTDWNELLNRSDVANRGISGDISEGMLNRMASVLKVKPKLCFFMGGINDISRRVSYDKTLSNIKQIAGILTQNGVKPIIQSVLYTGDEFYGRDYNNPIVKRLNSELEKFCSENGILFLDLNKHLSENDILKNEYTHDGLHLNAKGYEAWAKIITGLLDHLSR
jgi:lysophospholipase L1-like esterase